MSISPGSRFFGAWVVRSAFVMAFFGWGVGFYGPPIYLAQVAGRTPWSLPLVSAAVTLHFLSGAVVNAGLPYLYARAGVCRVTLLGAIVTAVGVLGWSLASEPWQLFMAATMTGMGWVTMGAVAVNSVVAPWYDRLRPQALAKAYNGASIGGAVFAPLWTWLIARAGFPVAAACVGGFMVAVVAMLAWRVFRHGPADLAQLPDGDPPPSATAASAEPQPHAAPRAGPPPAPRSLGSGAAPWRDRRLVTLAVAMAMSLFAQAGLLMHLYGMLIPSLGAQRTGLLMGCGTACAMLGRAVAARIATQRNMDRRAVAIGGYAIQALGALLLWLGYPDRPWVLVAGVLLFGSGIGNATSLPPVIAQAEFRTSDVARVVAMIVAVSQATYAFAPAVFGVLREPPLERSEGVVFLVAAAIQLIAAAAMAMGRRPGL